jgi:hypothetical protein
MYHSTTLKLPPLLRGKTSPLTFPKFPKLRPSRSRLEAIRKTFLQSSLSHLPKIPENPQPQRSAHAKS